jgi:hypothetical protein
MFKKIAAALRGALNRGWSFRIKFPLPVLFAAAILSASIVAIAASSPVNYYGTLIVPTGGTITDTNATPSACVGTTAAKVYTYGSNCVTSVTASGNIASSGGTNPNLTFTGVLPTGNGGTGTTTGVCSTCAVTNANNYFSANQTIQGTLFPINVSIPAAGTATSTTNYGSEGGYYVYNSLWNGSAAVSNSWELGADSTGNIDFFYNGTPELQTTPSGSLYASNLIIPAAGTATSTTNYGSEGGFYLYNSIWNGTAPVSNSWTLSAASTGNLLFNYNGTPELQTTPSGAFSVANLYDTGVAANSLACLGTGSLFAACTVSSPLSFSGTTLSLTTVPISLGGTNATSATTGCIGYNGTAYANSNCVDTAGTALSLSGTKLSLTTPLITAYGGTNKASWTSGECVRSSSATQLANAAGDCVTSVTAGNGITSTGGTTPAVSVTNCGASICRAKIEAVIGAESGTVSTSDSFYTLPVASFSNGQLTTIRAFCTTKDNGTTVFTAYTVNYSTGAETSIGTLTLSSTNFESDGTITPVNLSPPEGITGAITTAGTAANCSFVLDGYQDVY